MYSSARNECSHSLGFPIRKSPDHSLLAASRGLSQLATSFFAYLRQGIHTHALSSLTIKLTLRSEFFYPKLHPNPHSPTPQARFPSRKNEPKQQEIQDRNGAAVAYRYPFSRQLAT